MFIYHIYYIIQLGRTRRNYLMARSKKEVAALISFKIPKAEPRLRCFSLALRKIYPHRPASHHPLGPPPRNLPTVFHLLMGPAISEAPQIGPTQRKIRGPSNRGVLLILRPQIPPPPLAHAGLHFRYICVFLNSPKPDEVQLCTGGPFDATGGGGHFDLPSKHLFSTI